MEPQKIFQISKWLGRTLVGGGLVFSAFGLSACGNSGAQGPAGPQGAQGPQGDPGPQGEQGLKGDQGLQGAQGPQGDPGVAGAQGIQGDPGPQGAQGIPGVAGAPGAPGAPGAAGAAGADGSVLFKRVSIGTSINAVGTTNLGSIAFTAPVAGVTGKLAVISARGHCTISGAAGGGPNEYTVGVVNAGLFDLGIIHTETLAPGQAAKVNWASESTIATTPGVQQTVSIEAKRVIGAPSLGESCGGIVSVTIVDDTKL